MARFKDHGTAQGKLIAVSFEAQLQPGTFEHTLNHLIDHKLDLSVFEARYRNDDGGAPAYHPAVLLKIILFAYSRGIVSSRRIEQACRENVTFMALSGDSQPHYTTIAHFISSLHDEITALFRDVLLICDQLGLIGRQMFAIDGCKLASNASKQWSGTKAGLMKRRAKLERNVSYLLTKHRQEDEAEGSGDAPQRRREQKQLKTLTARIDKLSAWLDSHDDKPGKSGRPKQSNLTDNDSALMKTHRGVIQGYNGVAAADDKHQVVLHAEAFGEGQEHDLFTPMLDGVEQNLPDDALGQAKVTADAGYFSENNLKHCAEQGIDAYIADPQLRQRDPRFTDPDSRYSEQKRQRRRGNPDHPYPQERFIIDAATETCLCPAGAKLYVKHRNARFGKLIATVYQGAKRDCGPCLLRAKCLKHPNQKTSRQVAVFQGKHPNAAETYSERMRRKLDTPTGRAIYSRRLGTVEPVFARITHALGLNRFTLRGKRKVDTQWKLYCLVHNLTKIHRYGTGFG